MDELDRPIVQALIERSKIGESRTDTNGEEISKLTFFTNSSVRWTFEQ